MDNHTQRAGSTNRWQRQLLLAVGVLPVCLCAASVVVPELSVESLFRSSNSQFGQGVADMVAGFRTVARGVLAVADFGRSSIIGLGVMPLVSLLIVFQLVGNAYPPLLRIKNGGEAQHV